MASNDPSTPSRVSVLPSSHTVTGSESIDHSSYDTNDDILTQERRRLRRHLGLGQDPGDSQLDCPEVEPLFFIERAPDSRNGAKCKLPIYSGRIEPGELRLALNPSIGHSSWYQNSTSKRRLFQQLYFSQERDEDNSFSY
jgi:hypothetical protein